MLPTAVKPKETPPPAGFLPDFCRFGTLFPLLLLTELTALVLSLAGQQPDFWTDLGGRSLFMLWIALGSAALLCALRRLLGRLEDRWSGLAAFAVVQTVTLLANWLVYVALPVAGWFVALLPEAQIPSAIARNLAVSGLITAVLLRYLFMQASWRSQLRAEANARLDALQARMRPHFLFNSLNTIASLVRDRPAQAEELVLDLAELFRTSLRRDQRWVTLAAEATLTRQYLNIESQRLGSRLQLDWRLEGLPQDALLPPLSLQPLVENAVYHGIEPMAQGGTLQVVGRQRDGLLAITVCNPLSPGGRRRSGNQQALENLQARWSACFPGAGALEFKNHGDRFCASLVFPYVTATDENPDR